MLGHKPLPVPSYPPQIPQKFAWDRIGASAVIRRSPSAWLLLNCVWNVMTHAQEPDFVFRRNGRVHLHRLGASVHSTAGSRSVRMSGSNARYTMFRGSVKSTGYPLHSPVSSSLPLPCVTLCHHILTGLYFGQPKLTLRPRREEKKTMKVLKDRLVL